MSKEAQAYLMAQRCNGTSKNFLTTMLRPELIIAGHVDLAEEESLTKESLKIEKTVLYSIQYSVLLQP